MLYIKQCCTSNNVVHQTMLYIKQCYTSNNVIHQTMLYIKQCYTSNSVIHQTMLYIKQCCTSNNVVHQTVLYIKQCCIYVKLVVISSSFCVSTFTNRLCVFTLVVFLLIVCVCLPLWYFYLSFVCVYPCGIFTNRLCVFTLVVFLFIRFIEVTNNANNFMNIFVTS